MRQSLENVSPLSNVASFSIISLSYGKEDRILGGPLRAINSLSAEDNCLQLAESCMQHCKMRPHSWSLV